MSILEFLEPLSKKQIRQRKIEKLKRAFRGELNQLDSRQREFSENVAKWLNLSVGGAFAALAFYYLLQDPEYLTKDSVIKPQPEMLEEASDENLSSGEFAVQEPTEEERAKLLEEALNEAEIDRGDVPDSHFKS